MRCPECGFENKETVVVVHPRIDGKAVAELLGQRWLHPEETGEEE